MQPEQPAAPSEQEPVADAPSSADAGSEQAQGISTPPWWRRLWRGRDDGSAEETAEDPSAAQEPSRLSLTQEELDRRVQAETDRREAKRAAQALADRKRKLRDEDPWQYAEEERQAENVAASNQQIGDLFGRIGSEHDKYTLDPLVLSLPPSERERILKLEGAGIGLDGRKLIVDESLKALEKHWKAEGAKEAEKRLRSNSAFRKQVLSEFRRGAVEPEFIGSGNSSSGTDHNVSAILREGMSRHRSM